MIYKRGKKIWMRIKQMQKYFQLWSYIGGKREKKNSWKAKRKNDFISVCTKLLPCMWKEAIISYKFKNNYNEFIALNPSKIYLSKSWLCSTIFSYGSPSSIIFVSKSLFFSINDCNSESIYILLSGVIIHLCKCKKCRNL